MFVNILQNFVNNFAEKSHEFCHSVPLGEGRSAAHCQTLRKAWSAGKDKWFFPCIQLPYLEHYVQFGTLWLPDSDILELIQQRSLKR